MFANRIPRNAFDIRLKKASYGEYLDSISDFDWLHLQDQSGPVALATNSALALSLRNIIVGTDSNFSGAGNWVGVTYGTFDINTTVPGKAYGVGNSGTDRMSLLNALTVGKEYRITFKSRLNAGASKTIFAGSDLLTSSARIAFTPTGTEDTYTGTFTANTTRLDIGLEVDGVNGLAFEFDDIVVQQTNIAASGDFPGADVIVNGSFDTDTDWTKGDAAITIASGKATWSGAQAGNADLTATVAPLTSGIRYKQFIVLSGVSAGTITPIFGTQTGTALNVNGTYPLAEEIANGTAFLLRGDRSFVGSCELVKIQPANPMNVKNNGMAIGQPGAGNVPYIFLGDGATTGLVYDTIAEWNSKFNPDKLTMAVVVRVDDWSAGTGVIWRLAVDANTEAVLERRGSILAWRYRVAGNTNEVTFDTATLPGGSPSEPFTMVMTVDTDGAGEIIGYMKGVARGTSTITGEWVGNFDPAECAVFAADAIQTNSLDGGGAHVGLGYRVMTPVEAAQFDLRSGL